MNPSPLETLHQQFDKALKNHAYIGVSNTGALEKTDTKPIRLHEVFQHARQQIENDLQAAQPLNSANELSHLKLLKEDGKEFYARYQTATNTWTRTLLKGLAHYTPAFLKTYLPACFSNGMADAEKQTKDEYEEYKKLVNKHIQSLSRKVKLDPADEAVEKVLGDDDKVAAKSDEELNDELLNQLYDEDAGLGEEFEDLNGSDPRDPASKKRAQLTLEAIERRKAKQQADKTEKPKSAQPKPVDLDFEEILDDDALYGDTDPKGKPAAKERAAPELIALPEAPVQAIEEIEARKASDQEAASNKIEDCMNAFKEFDQFPLSLEKYKNLLGQLGQAVQQVLDLDAVDGKKTLTTAGIADADLTALSDPKFSEALTSDDRQKLKDLLAPTQWSASFAKAEAQQGYITFGIKKFAGQTDIVLQNDKGTRITPKDFATYQGKVRIALADVNLFTSLTELEKFVEANQTCRPCTIEIQVKDQQTLTPDLVKLLLSLSERSAEIQVLGLKELNFKQDAISAEDEYKLVQYLDTINFSGIDTIILSDHPKTDWSSDDFSALLSLCPKMALLQEFCGLCSSPRDIALPKDLLTLQKLDLKGFAVDLIPHLLAQFAEANEVNLSGCAATDDQMGVWIAGGCFANVHTLQLDDCKALTTDVLHYLMKLENLTTLSLPDLPAGKHSLDKLPCFDNPFKINLFYTASKATQKIAAERYTGPVTWAPAFQIPLARQKSGAPIFTSAMTALDPKSVAFWLYNDDYLHLEPQTSISSVLADSNAGLTDDNIVKFMEKFPNAFSLSLFNCPNVTTDGIVKLLKANVCPKLRSLDLTGCPQITEDLFSGNLPFLEKLRKIIITDTKIAPDSAKGIQEQMQRDFVQRNFTKQDENDFVTILECEKTTLTITDDDLTDDQALDTLLKGEPLNTLKRINLEGCTKLTNAMLGQLLDHLNTDIFIKNGDGAVIDNPQRLNLAVLNLSDCSAITEEAFDGEKTDDGKINPKLLENLDRIIIGGTNIKDVLKGVYPQVTFQDLEEPVTLAIDPNAQLQMCQLFYQTQDEAAKKELAATFVSNRIAVEIFGSACDDQGVVKEVRSHPVDTADEQFCDITLTFKTDDAAAPSVYPAHRDVLYGRSLYFVNGFRPGGLLSKLPGLDYVNVHATPEASEAIIDLFYGRLNMNTLAWKTAADAAELAGPHIFKLPSSSKNALLDRFRSQFDPKQAEPMLMAAQKLMDKEGIKQFEFLLIACLESLGTITSANRNQFQPYANIAKNHGLAELKKKTDAIEEALTKEAQKKIAEANAKDAALLTEQMIKNGGLANIV